MKIKGLRWWVIGLIALATIINYIDRQSINVLWPEISEQLYPDKTGDVDVIIFQLASPTTNINDFPEHSNIPRKDNPAWLDSYFQMDRTDYLASIEGLLSRKEYGILFWEEPWLVFSKGSGRDQPETIRGVNQSLKNLRNEWQITSAE